MSRWEALAPRRFRVLSIARKPNPILVTVFLLLWRDMRTIVRCVSHAHSFKRVCIVQDVTRFDCASCAMLGVFLFALNAPETLLCLGGRPSWAYAGTGLALVSTCQP